jgi:hypothetical protein
MLSDDGFAMASDCRAAREACLGTKGTPVCYAADDGMEAVMSFGKGVLLWLIGIPLPIILLLALFMHH